MNSVFWFGLALGFAANVVASQCWEFVMRYRAWKNARRLAGTWVAHNMKGRTIEPTPMPGAGLTEVTATKSCLSANSSLLGVRAYDIGSNGERRDHDGYIVFDPAIPWLATRIDRYADSNEIAEQRLVIASDYNTVYVFPVATVATLGDVYGKHAWRRKN